MPKKISDVEYQNIVDLLSQHSQGLGLEALLHLLQPVLARRTLQRRLTLLHRGKKISIRGRGPARRYFSTTAAQKVPQRFTTYQRSFLAAYQSHITAYLPETTRLHLQNISGTPQKSLPGGTYAKQILHRFLIDLSWNSSRLEGNTYSLLETERLIQFGQESKGKSAFETQMILNHKAAIEFLVTLGDELQFSRYCILNLHALLSDNLLPNPHSIGRLRQIAVAITGTAYAPPAIPAVIEECFELLLNKARGIQNPFEQAFFSMVHLPYLQPFEDVNKRVSRLAANIPLIRHNLCPLSFVGVTEKTYVDALLAVYEQNNIELLRELFVFAYEQSAKRYAMIKQELAEPDPLRFTYQTLLKQTVTHIVEKKWGHSRAITFIRQQAQKYIPFSSQAKFIEMVETELLNLHEGNIARYRIRLPAYQAWQQVNTIS